MTDQALFQSDRNGILLIEKPRDMTSFGVVSRLRRLVGVKKIGHTGTLDPFAEGLLAICVGRATGVVQFMDTYDKSYRVRICFGRATDTMDLTGTTLAEHVWAPGELTQLQKTDFAEIRQAVDRLQGPSLQLPPMYSAVKIDGQPLYKLARAGQTVERQARPIVVYSAQIEAILCSEGFETTLPSLELDLVLNVSKGTYIRVIADELGKALGWFGHAVTLERLTVGPFSRNQAWTLPQLEALFDSNPDRVSAQQHVWQSLKDQGAVHAMDEALTDVPALSLSRRQALRLTQGQRVLMDSAAMSSLPDWVKTADPSGKIALWCECGLLGVAHLEKLPDEQQTPYRIVTERIFLSHECLLPD